LTSASRRASERHRQGKIDHERQQASTEVSRALRSSGLLSRLACRFTKLRPISGEDCAAQADDEDGQQTSVAEPELSLTAGTSKS